MKRNVMKQFLNIAVLIILTTAVALAQGRGGGGGQRGGGGGGQRGTPAPPRPAPHWPDGRMNLGPVPGEKGLWEVGPTTQPLARPDKVEDFGLFAADAREPSDPFLAAKPKLSQLPFQPWARALFADRVQHRREPYTRCKPSPASRQVATAYGTQFVDAPEIKRLYIFETGGAHSYRTIYMDGRAHPPNATPAYRGHSVGRWEGDTLIVDTVGFSEGAWIDNLGLPTTEKLHTIERFTRTDYTTIKYEITVDDPGAYTAPWQSGYYMRWSNGAESFEFVCQDNNKTTDLMVGDGTLISEKPAFVP